MAQLPQRGDTGFTLAGFLILTALGTFLWKGAPLESVRPSSEQSGGYDSEFAQQVPARLWQDPFKAVYAHEQVIKADKSAAINIEGPGQKIQKIIDGKQAQGVTTELTVLMVMVSPGSYAELEERRRRRRYAVLSGLGEENFVPRNPETLNVFYRTDAGTYAPKTDSATKSSAENEASKQKKITEKPYAVPYEWYDYEDPSGKNTGQKQVLVLWLNESHFVDSPLKSIQLLLKQLLSGADPTKITLRATLLGPARSDALRNLVTKEESGAYQWLRCDSGLSEFNITSSTATVADADLNRNWSDDSKQGKQTAPTLATLHQRYIKKTKCEKQKDVKSPTRMHFLRTIRSDEELIKKLVDELKNSRLMTSPKESKEYVVVISEWDTYFGRSLPRAFTKHYCESDCDNVLRYSYQRGMDGIVTGAQSAPPSPASSKQSSAYGLTPSIDVATMRRPVGTGQFDYLRRLAADIRKQDRELRLETGHGVRAVVLLGSDVYDKLLILRALRPELTGAIFATTDLDANLLHPAEYNWTRNLIVASTYDLRLPSITVEKKEEKSTTMPFRDSYQTSIHLATRLVFNKTLKTIFEPYSNDPPNQDNDRAMQEEIYKKIPPQLFEVGRQGVVRLSSSEDSANTWNHVLESSFAKPVALGLVFIALLGIFAFHQLRPRSGRVVIVLSILLLAFLALSIAILTGVEPLTLVAGVSIWPAQYIRIFTLVLAFVFIWSVVHRLQNSWRELGARYFGISGETNPDGATLKEVLGKLLCKLRHPIQTLRQIQFSHFLSATMLIVIMLVMMIMLPYKLPLFKKLCWLISIWFILLLAWWAIIYEKIWEGISVRSINKWVDADLQNDAVKMWETYGEYGNGEQRFLRTIAYVLMYVAFASILFVILGLPESPCRGKVSCTIDKAILGFSVLSMLVLLFLVVDAARLCICWVDSMREYDLKWNKTKKDEFIQNLRLPDTHAETWIQIHLIGERTAEVTRLIYYPVLIVLLLLLARSTYFDNWDFPQALAIVVGMNFIIALGSVVRLNFTAQSVRTELLRELQEEKLAGDKAQKESYEPTTVERQELINQLENLRIGAYLPLWDQPPVRATLMLLGGVALTYAEYISIFLR